MKTRITGRFVIGYAAEHNGGDHVVYRDGEVVYEDDRVIFVGHGYPGAVDREIATGDALISPGFLDMNALADIDHGILDTWPTADLMTGHVWSEDYFKNRRHELFSADDERFNRRYALTQLLLNGITTALPIAAETYREWCETEDQIADMADIAGELGLRLYVGQAYRSGINIIRSDGSRDVAWDEARGEEGLEQAASIVRRFDGAYNGRIRGAFLPCRIETVTLDILRKTKQYADELRVPIKLHAAQGLPELGLIQKWHGKRSIELLGEIGFLGPNVGIPHVFFIGGRNGVPDDGADELALLRDTDTTVIHCPIPAARHARSLDTFDGYREAGVNIALGTDMFPPDIIRAMDYASNMAKQRVRDQAVGSAADMFRAATLGGAKLLGREDLGRLAPGSKADITIVDLSQIRTGPIDDPIRTMVMNANGSQVRTVIVDGKTVVENGQIPGQDVEAMRARAQRYFETYKTAYSERDYLRRPTDVLFPPSFKTVERGPA